MLTRETTVTEQDMIDRFIRYNIKMLAKMDERNAMDYTFYERDVEYLKAGNPYERKRAVRRILEMFMADWD